MGLKMVITGLDTNISKATALRNGFQPADRAKHDDAAQRQKHRVERLDGPGRAGHREAYSMSSTSLMRRKLDEASMKIVNPSLAA